MGSYEERLREHLAAYKVERLEVQTEGIWRRNRRRYPHILPESKRRSNILGTIRDEFWDWFEKGGEKVTLHRDFHHLTSSQAMCFNLFFSFKHPQLALDPVLRALGQPAQPVQECRFEHILDDEEGTNLDFFILLRSGVRLLFELKLAEREFGRAQNDEPHRRKLKKIYGPRLPGRVSPSFLEQDVFFRNYQLMRNLSCLREQPEDRLYLVLPRANESLTGGIELLFQNLTPCWAQRVEVVYLEDLVPALLGQGDLAPRCREALQEFARKYLPAS